MPRSAPRGSPSSDPRRSGIFAPPSTYLPASFVLIKKPTLSTFLLHYKASTRGLSSMERFTYPKNLSSSHKNMFKELIHRQKIRYLFDTHSQAGNNTEQPLFGEHVANVLRSFSNTLSESTSTESDEVLQVPTNACVWSELSDEESINSPFQRSLGDDIMMEDPEIEKGEAYSYHIDQGFDDDIDPDVSLSYIGEKIQRVLGHFRKDFEPGVSAERLGAKFGGYGSFLSAYETMEDPKLEEEKIQRVLGHLRKDFEGGLSAERLGAKFGGYSSFLPAEKRMEDPKLEEGKAYSYHDNGHGFNDDIDLDVSLSYIGEKIQQVLGHFRKDFEGGVSAENLGAKFGGYGSFLRGYEKLQYPKLKEGKA